MMKANLDKLERNLEMLGAIEKYGKVVTVKDARDLSIYFLMSTVQGKRDYVSKFYDLLKERKAITDETAKIFMEDWSKRGNPEEIILYSLMNETKDPSVNNMITLALKYADKVCKKPKDPEKEMDKKIEKAMKEEPEYEPFTKKDLEQEPNMPVPKSPVHHD